MDDKTGGRAGGRAGGRVDGRTDRPTDRPTDRSTDRPTHGRNGQRDGPTDRRTDGPTSIYLCTNHPPMYACTCARELLPQGAHQLVGGLCQGPRRPALTRPIEASGRRGGCLSVCPLLDFICIVASIRKLVGNNCGNHSTRRWLPVFFKIEKTIRGPRVECSGVSVDASQELIGQHRARALSQCRLVSKSIPTYLLLPVAVDR